MKRIKKYSSVIIALFIGVLISGATLRLGNNLSLVSYVYDILSIQYVDKSVENDTLIHGAIKGMLAALDDPYTRFMSPKNYSEMKIRLSGEFSGIGIQIGLRDNQLTVISPIYNTPAYKAGLKSQDKILKIDDTETTDMGLTDAVSLIRGKKGSAVILKILGRNETDPRDVSITRDTIRINAIEKQAVFDKTGYIKYSTFESKQGADELKTAIQDMQASGIKNLILDLRDNGGGLLDGAVQLTSFFVPEGAVVHTVDRNKTRETLYVSGDAFYDDPLVILINSGSASSSEIVAGALRDNGRATLIGEPSFGKASVQNVLPLRDGSAVLYTIAKYLTPNGDNIHEVGIPPDVQIDLSPEALKIYYDPDAYTYESDAQLQAALAYFTN